mmetsp:Transcript_8480/g.21707  ORF Transcript_8480/g.21707 Transcript_8480/m.21707 type:complete len:524 (+) Transcript_8480:421-1992(+)
MQLEHGDEGELRGPHLAGQHVLEELLASGVLAGMAASLQEVGVDDVVGRESGNLHVLEEAECSFEVVLVHKSLDEHRVCDDVGMCTFAALHLLAEIERALQAAGLHEALDEERAHDRVQGSVAAQEQVDNLVGDLHVVVGDAKVEQGAEGYRIGFDTSVSHLVKAVEALRRIDGLCEALDDSVVGHHIDDFLGRPLLLEAVRVAQNLQRALGLLGVRAREQQQVQHQVRRVLAELSEDALCCIGVVEHLVGPEEEHVILGLDVHPAVLLEHAGGPLRLPHVQGGVDEAGQRDLVRRDHAAEDRVDREAGAEVLAAGEHLEGRLPELTGGRRAVALHIPEHALHDVDLADADGRLDEGRIALLAEARVATIPLQGAEEVQRPRELALLQVLHHDLFQGDVLGLPGIALDGLDNASQPQALGGSIYAEGLLIGLGLAFVRLPATMRALTELAPEYEGDAEDREDEDLLGEGANGAVEYGLDGAGEGRAVGARHRCDYGLFENLRELEPCWTRKDDAGGIGRTTMQ